jgi:hypothetical protein
MQGNGRSGGNRGGNSAVREIDEKIESLTTARNILAADSGGGRGFGQSAGRGGARPGAGRPKGSSNRGRGRRDGGTGNE